MSTFTAAPWLPSRGDRRKPSCHRRGSRGATLPVPGFGDTSGDTCCPELIAEIFPKFGRCSGAATSKSALRRIPPSPPTNIDYIQLFRLIKLIPWHFPWHMFWKSQLANSAPRRRLKAGHARACRKPRAVDVNGQPPFIAAIGGM